MVYDGPHYDAPFSKFAVFFVNLSLFSPAGCERHILLVFCLHRISVEVFRPFGRVVAPVWVEFGIEETTKGQLLHAIFYHHECKGVTWGLKL